MLRNAVQLLVGNNTRLKHFHLKLLPEDTRRTYRHTHKHTYMKPNLSQTPTCHLRMLHVLMYIPGEGVMQKSVATNLLALHNCMHKIHMSAQISLCEEHVLATEIVRQWTSEVHGHRALFQLLQFTHPHPYFQFGSPNLQRHTCTDITHKKQNETSIHNAHPSHHALLPEQFSHLTFHRKSQPNDILVYH